MNDFELNVALCEIIEPGIYEYWRHWDFNNWEQLIPLLSTLAGKVEIFNRDNHFTCRMADLKSGFDVSSRAITLSRVMANCCFMLLEARK